jgi:hypothetical protein
MCGTFHTRMRQSSVAPIVKVVVGFSQIANCLTPALPEPCSILRIIRNAGGVFWVRDMSSEWGYDD